MKMSPFPVLKTLLFGVALAWAAQSSAQSVPVPDPKDWAAMSPHQQDQRRSEIRRQLQHASPQEREEFRRQMRERLQQMSPAERQALIARARDGWNGMSPQDREKFREERQAKIQAMPPEQRKDLLRQRRAMLEKLSPEERARLKYWATKYVANGAYCLKNGINVSGPLPS